MDIVYLAYLLFIFPGFCFVWTYRHFTKKPKLGEFEYAAWSFLFGILMFWIVFSTGGEELDFMMDLNKPFELFSHGLGAGLGVALAASFPLGFMGAVISKWGLFTWIDKILFKLIEKLSKV